MIHLFNKRWDDVPIVVVDVETTGTLPGVDAAVQVALVRFEGRHVVGRFATLLDPGMAIPSAATEIHGITDELVAKAPLIDEVFAEPDVQALLKESEPAAYNAQFDRAFVPLHAFPDWSWPWIDPLTFVRVVDRFVRGQGRHKLEAACLRRGITITKAHDAAADAEAAGLLFYAVLDELFASSTFPRPAPDTLGGVLAYQRHHEADEWWRFNSWLSQQPPRQEATP